jgi:hypothetical protein
MFFYVITMSFRLEVTKHNRKFIVEEYPLRKESLVFNIDCLE